MTGEIAVAFSAGLVVGAIAMRIVLSWADRNNKDDGGRE
jgi:hypothetical protein